MDDNIVIITKDKDKIDESFKDKYNNGTFRKIVKPNELSECISIMPYGIIENEKVYISKEKEDQFEVGTGFLLTGTKLNLQRIDRDDWRGWVL